MKKLSVRLIELYQVFLSFDHGLLSVFTPGGACRYPISCSEYTKQSILRHGMAQGIWLGLKRLWRCR